MKNKVLIMRQADLSTSPRVICAMKACSGYEISCIGLKKNDNFINNFFASQKTKISFWRNILVRFLLFMRLYRFLPNVIDGGIHFYDSGFNSININDIPKPDLIIAGGLDILEFAVKIKNVTGAKLVYDSHDYWPALYEDQFEWRITWMKYMQWLSRKLLPHCDAITTVSQGLADKIESDCGIKPAVILNVPKYAELEPVKCNKDKVRLIHQGYAHKSRHLELMIDIMQYLDERFTLDLLLISSGSKMSSDYLEHLKNLAKNYENIQFLSPINSDSVTNFINKYDIGIYLMPPVNFNHVHALPNKIFQFIQARLAIAIGPSPDMAKIVNEHKLGVVSDDFSPQNLAAKLNALTAEDIMRFKWNSHNAAKIYNSENEEAKLKNIYLSLLGDKK